MKKLLIGLLLLLLCPFTIQAKEEYITFDSRILVTENRVLQVQESYYLLFSENNSVYNRVLPLSTTIVHPYDEISTTKILYDNITFTDKTFKSKKTKNDITLTLDDLYQKDQTEYIQLSYQYQYGKDKNYLNELYFDIVKKGHNSVVSNVNFYIQMPYQLYSPDLHFFIDGKEIDSMLVSSYVSGDVIGGNLLDILEKDQSFSIRVDLPEGYFQDIPSLNGKSTFLSLIIPFISLIFSGIIWLIYKGKGNTQTKTLIPPHNFDVAEVSYLYRGYTENTDIACLLIELANAGYLAVVETDEIQLVKLKDYDKNNAAQKIIFEGIFKSSRVVKIDELSKYRDVFKQAKATLDNDEHQKQLFTTKKLLPFIFIICLYICGCSILWYQCKLLFGNAFFSLLVSLLMSFGCYLMFFKSWKSFTSNVIGFICLGLSLYVGIVPHIHNFGNLIIFIIGLILTISLIIGYNSLPKRSEFGNAMLQDMINFRYTLINLPNYELQQIISKNKNYFYAVLPYAYALGFYEEWMHKGKTLGLSVPHWYRSNNQFVYQDFYASFKVWVQSITKAFLQEYKVNQQIYFEKAKHIQNLDD